MACGGIAGASVSSSAAIARLAAMTKQDPQLLEVLVRQVAKNVSIDRARAKDRLVPVKAEAPQPTPQVHDRALAHP